MNDMTVEYQIFWFMVYLLESFIKQFKPNMSAGITKEEKKTTMKYFH